jgi:outer membrane protein OmpA-like peptidoglycan-associated protein
MISAKGYGFISASTNIDLTKTNTPPKVATNELTITTIEAGNAINLNNIFFEIGKAALLPESFLELNRIAEFLKKNASIATEIAGHTDNVGTDAANQTLSQDRANAVRYYRGIQATRLIGKGYGKNKPLVPNTTEIGRQQNHRVEFVILRK